MRMLLQRRRRLGLRLRILLLRRRRRLSTSRPLLSSSRRHIPRAHHPLRRPLSLCLSLSLSLSLTMPLPRRTRGSIRLVHLRRWPGGTRQRNGREGPGPRLEALRGRDGGPRGRGTQGRGRCVVRGVLLRWRGRRRILLLRSRADSVTLLLFPRHRASRTNPLTLPPVPNRNLLPRVLKEEPPRICPHKIFPLFTLLAPLLPTRFQQRGRGTLIVVLLHRRFSGQLCHEARGSGLRGVELRDEADGGGARVGRGGGLRGGLGGGVVGVPGRVGGLRWELRGGTLLRRVLRLGVGRVDVLEFPSLRCVLARRRRLLAG